MLGMSVLRFKFINAINSRPRFYVLVSKNNWLHDFLLESQMWEAYASHICSYNDSKKHKQPKHTQGESWSFWDQIDTLFQKLTHISFVCKK